MAHNVIIIAGLSLLLVARTACDYVRISMLKRFAEQNGIAIVGRLWWNNREVQRMSNSLPEGLLKTRVKLLQNVVWPISIAFFVVIMFDSLHMLQHLR